MSAGFKKLTPNVSLIGENSESVVEPANIKLSPLNSTSETLSQFQRVF